MKLLISICLLAASYVAGASPNVIVLITDDQGYPELSAHGNPALKTPHLDRLHAGAVRLTDFHVSPMCTPTRGQFLTGLDPARNGAINVSSGRTLLRANLPTMADFFRRAGYRTGQFGKWHLGDNYPYRPQDRGFEETLWFPSSHINSTPDAWDNDYFDDTYRRNGALAEYEGYCTDVFFEEAIAWMRERARSGEPFLTYLATNTPHWPHWVPEADLRAQEKDYAAAEEQGRIPKLAPTRRESLVRYLAMIRNIDRNFGNLESFLGKTGISDNTIVVFLTDNGSTFGEIYFNAGMRGRKTQLWEGGHRVPCFVRWPGGGIGGGRDVDGLTQVQDLLPTLLDLAGIPAEDNPDFDGVSLAGVLRGNETVDPERMLVINYSRMPIGFDYPSPDSPSIMRRSGAGVLWKRWRLLEETRLYDLAADPMQKENVIERYPEVAARMQARLDAWWEQVGPAANEPQAVVIGHEAENPAMLTACEWLDVFIDQQVQIRRADLKNGWWELEVARPGTYSFELRRWPREAGAGLSEGLPGVAVTDGTLMEGAALPIAAARLQIGTERQQRREVKPADKSVTFSARLEAGRTRLHTWFDDANRQPLCGAYYVYVERK